MHIAIARFPAVPAELDKDFRDWFAWSNDQLSEIAGLKARRLLCAPDGSYTVLVEHESTSSFAAMHTAEAVSMIHKGLGKILNDGPQTTSYEVLGGLETSGGCCGDGPGAGTHERPALAQVSGGCCQKA